jgi:hypothetical protein
MFNRAGPRQTGVNTRRRQVMPVAADRCRTPEKARNASRTEDYRHIKPIPATEMQHTIPSLRHFAFTAMRPSITARPIHIRAIPNKCLDIVTSI